MLPPRLSPLRSATRKTGIRRTALAAAAAILLCVPTAAVATAEPDQSPDLPAGLAAAVARDLHISPEEYLQRADLAQEVATFTTTAQRDYPDVFAGSWLDAGRAVVAVAQGSSADTVKQAAESSGFTVRNVAKSEAALREEKSAFERWLEGQPEAVRSLVRGAVIDTVNNTVAVRVDQAGLPMPSFIDPARVIVTAPPMANENAPIPAGEIAGTNRAFTAGDGYASGSDGVSLRCSLGFNGIDHRTGDTVNITAGHCNPDIPSAGHGNAAGIYELNGNQPGPLLGVFEKSVLGEQDYSIVRISDRAEGQFSNSGVRIPGSAPMVIEGVGTPVVGAPVCKSGMRTGFSCGVINAVDQTVRVGDHMLSQSFSANICALPGDSGGPIVTGRLALGISSASSVADFSFCVIPNLIGAITGDAPQLFGQPLDVVFSDNPGLAVFTNSP
ncbi:S1 family peptidase [Nocardia sp. CNY236]|uniref:S1 family peptidase n=1 Tax=Nocardia sp. CNY236 TaxID=1169152 RepID=UPI0003FF3DDD|nr:S1 family peptidase [Nocardia sp. CNY236]